jgi:hypothetical protein
MDEFFIEVRLNAAGEEEYSLVSEYRSDRQFGQYSTNEGYPGMYISEISNN